MIINYKEREEFIQSFKKLCVDRYGIYPIITYKELYDVSHPSDTLEDLVNSYIPISMKAQFPSIFIKNRKRELSLLKHIYAMLARDEGVRLSTICRKFDYKHSSIIYLIQQGYNLLEGDPHFRELYINISKRFKPDKYPHARIIEDTEKVQTDSRSTNFPILHPRKYKVFRPDRKRRTFREILQDKESA